MINGLVCPFGIAGMGSRAETGKGSWTTWKHEHHWINWVRRFGGDLVRSETARVFTPDRPGSVAVSASGKAAGTDGGAAAVGDVRSAAGKA